MSVPLTDKQRYVYQFIRGRVVARKMPFPTPAEIQRYMGWETVQSAYDVLLRLERLGRVQSHLVYGPGRMKAWQLVSKRRPRKRALAPR